MSSSLRRKQLLVRRRHTSRQQSPTTVLSLGDSALPSIVLSFCHSERGRISYLTALTGTTCVVLIKENHMQSFEAATLDRKSGEARNLQCAIRVPRILLFYHHLSP